MRRGLQIVLGILSLIPLLFCALGVVYGAGRFGGDVTAGLDNQFRYLSTYYLSLTLLMWWMSPNIERHTVPIRILIGVIFLGGLARAYSHFTVGAGDPGQFGGMVLELALIVVIPWQAIVAKRAAAANSSC